VLLLALFFVFQATPRVSAAIGAGAEDFTTRLGELFPTLQGSKPIDLPAGGGTVTAEAVAQGLPDFTKDPALVLNGRVPNFGGGGRTVEVSLNTQLEATLTPDTTGAFTTPLTLRDGPNAIALTLLSGTDVVATTSYTVVLDRQPPALTILSPKNGEIITGSSVVVTGKAEAGATIVVNDRTIVPAPDGSFTESFPYAPGDLQMTVIARDRAGNETTVKTSVTLRAPTSAATLVLTVTLDHTTVKPGAQVLATIRLTANGLPKLGESVTLSVGVITIGSAVTDASGTARIAFAAPPNEGDASVVVLANGATGRATLTVAK
jgi:glucodextranase-like protein